MQHLRTILTGLGAAVLALAGLTLGGLAPMAASGAASGAAANTTVTVKVANCEGCVVYASSIMAADPDDVWTAPGRKVRNGEAVLKVPTDRTAGLVLGVSAPWDVDLPWQTIAVMRYKGYDAGDKISTADAKASKKGAACWAGTTEAAYTLKLVVKKVTVDGNDGPTTGSIAFAKRTQDWLKPNRETWKGVLGSQDVIMCGPGGA